MTKLSTGTSFAQLFKKYRLLSEIETLAEFGDLLAEEGFVYETSLFTRWQKGDRIPKERRVILAILRVFAKRGGIVSIEEANSVVQSVNQKDLTHEESSALSEFIQTSNTKTLPVKPYLFVGRDELLKDLSWELINKKKVLLYGMPGVGKTYIAIYLAHQLKNFFSDGIFWFRADIKSYDDIVDELLSSFGGASYLSTDRKQKQERLIQIIQKRNILLILDNANTFNEEDLQIITSFPLTLLVTSIKNFTCEELHSYKTNTFTEEEFLILSEWVLGKPYVNMNQEKICQVGSELGFLPISSVISLKQIFSDPLKIQEYIKKIQDERINIKDVTYDDKNLYVAISLAFNRLGKSAQQILIACAIFDGTDFGLKPLASISNESLIKTRKYVEILMKLSFIETSSIGRYRLHPTVKDFLVNMIDPLIYLYLSQFYIREINKYKAKDSKYFQFFSKEIENILGLLKKNYRHKNYSYITELWPLISNYIFISGKWKAIHEYDSIIQSSYLLTNNQVGKAIYLIEDKGRIYFFQKKDKELNLLFQECVDIANKTKDKVLWGLIIQKQGLVNLYSNQFNEAKNFLVKSIRFLSKSKYKEQLYKSYAYLGMTYANLGEYDEAIKQISKALKNIKLLQDAAIIGFIYLYLGNSYLKMKKYQLAEKYLLLSLQSAKKADVLIEHGLASEGLGILYSKLDKNDKRANQYLKEAKGKFKLLGMDTGSKFFQ